MTHLITFNRASQSIEKEIISFSYPDLLKIARDYEVEKIIACTFRNSQPSNKDVEKYLSFICLCVLTDKPLVAPSRIIDEIWKAHILSSREYYLFCKAITGRYIHYNPPSDSTAEIKKDLADISAYSIYYLGEDTFNVSEQEQERLFLKYTSR